MRLGIIAPLGTALAAALCLATAPLEAAQHGKTHFAGHQSGLPQQQHYSVERFASGTTSYFNPDPIVVTRDYVYIAYQNATVPDGSDGGYSTVVQYRHDGRIVRGTNILGHCDGMRENPYTHDLWVLVNNDANPKLYTLGTNGGKPVPYTFVGTAHGGGYDDLAFANGKAFISGSNPTLNAHGINSGPAVYSVVLSNAKALVTPVLLGNQSGVKDVASGKNVTLNEMDPDSMNVDLAGNVVLVNQAGAEIVFIAKAGTAQQTVSRLLVGTQIDDTVFASGAAGSLFVVDSSANAIYVVRTKPFVTGLAYTEAPADSGVASFVGTVSLSTGTITPVLTGFESPTGLLFVPAAVFK